MCVFSPLHCTRTALSKKSSFRCDPSLQIGDELNDTHSRNHVCHRDLYIYAAQEFINNQQEHKKKQDASTVSGLHKKNRTGIRKVIVINLLPPLLAVCFLCAILIFQAVEAARVQREDVLCYGDAYHAAAHYGLHCLATLKPALCGVVTHCYFRLPVKRY
ncbi:hypothetical protein NDU88_005784 [Pleurodeles waltl]|uniref:Uncharacterized protein n=1 Tax=Pleurodeles waltl TaxID=8319 RepID=A0AAV7WDP4_PLEWA|nr:hypothetical protein NDU88_005784 [Pleurodeles waltl]